MPHTVCPGHLHVLPIEAVHQLMSESQNLAEGRESARDGIFRELSTSLCSDLQGYLEQLKK